MADKADKPDKPGKAEKSDKPDKGAVQGGKAMGAKLRRIREAAGLSQTELGDKLGVSYQQIQKYERGASRLSLDTFLRLARALEQPLAVFLPQGTWTDEPGRPDGRTKSEGGGGRVSEARPEYVPMSKDEKDLLKAYRELGTKRCAWPSSPRSRPQPPGNTDIR
jgi:transcriptional regulator with XRE-family HTH domain